MIKSKRLFITGFMGAGKSTVGYSLAQKLDWQFIDTDKLITEKAGMDIPSIFEQKGESYFRNVENEVIIEVCAIDHAVIALGGGALNNPENLARVKKSGLLIWLKVPLAEIANRLNKKGDRPLFSKEMNKNEKLYVDRQIQYQQAHFTIKNDSPVDEVVDQICAYLEEIDEISV